jgi:diaminopimelate decarboxylase
MTRTKLTGCPSTSTGLETWSASQDFHALAETFGTPTYLFNPARLRENVSDYIRLVDNPSRILYPVKTNPSFAVLRRLADLGCGMDCASRDEVDAALMAGVPYGRLSYNTPAPEFGLIRNLLRAGSTVVIDSEGLLAKANAKIAAPQALGSVMVRVNADVGGDYLQQFNWEEMVSHGSKTGKFGIPAERLVELLKQVSLPITGLHVHVGTMMDNLATFETVLAFLHRLMDDIQTRTAHRIQAVNLGGGLGIHFVPGQSFPTIAALAARLGALKRSGVSYYVEPGQSLVGDTMGLLTRVVGLKTMRGRRWAILDVGSDQLMKITTVGWYHQILDQRHQPLPFEGPDAIGGPLCFAGDTILPSTRLDGIQEGEVLFLQHAGAYLEAIANRFNGRRSAGLVVLDEAGSHRATKPEDPFFSPPVQTYDWGEAGLSLDPAKPDPAKPDPEKRDTDKSDTDKSDTAKRETERLGAARSEAVRPDDVTSGSERAGDAREFTSVEIAALRSSYFGEHARDDAYEILRFSQLDRRSFAFDVMTRCGVDFVSVPFAMRITADAVIIAVLSAMGKRIKDVSVWGSKGTFQYREPIQSGKRIGGTVTLSPLAAATAGKHKVVAVATLDGERFSMSSEVVV